MACVTAIASLTLLWSDGCQQQMKMIANNHTAFVSTIVKNDFVKAVKHKESYWH